MIKSTLLVLLLTYFSVAQALEPTEEYIRQYSEAVLEGTNGALAGQRIAAVTLLPTFYAQRAFQPVWSNPARFQELLEVLRSGESHGLDPVDYHYPVLSTWADDNSPRQQAARDLLATDALIRFGYHIHLGKLDPVDLDPNWNLNRRLHDEEAITLLTRAVAAPSLGTFLAELTPNGAFYAGLRIALAHYRDLAHRGGWPTVPGGAALHPGDRDARIPALRTRLSVTDAALVENTGADAQVFGAALTDAVMRFQLQHGLEADGVVGARTLAAINVPVAARIDQLRVNLERVRWVFRDHEPRYLVVNIAGYHAYLMDNGRIVWNSRVQVGKPFRQTPVFKSTLTYLVLNPTWTVPPTILKNDVIPRIRQNPAYLAENNMVLLDRSGQLLDSNYVDLSSVSPNYFPYTVRQEPGPKNALGRIKFMFPNQHAVYLHDTPSRALFNRAERSFSSGCIRVEEPFSLATLLLDDAQKWNETTIEARLANAKNETVRLKNPLTVFLMYWTSEPDGNGDAHFYNDVYSRDQDVLKGLQQPFRMPPMRRPERVAEAAQL